MKAELPAREPPQSLVPLARALEIIARRIYPATTRALPAPEAFDGIAAIMSALVPMFSIDGARAQRLDDSTLERARFRKAGTEMYFSDGRAPIANLAVTPDAIARVIRVLDGNSPQD
jgi:hypothetical protein